MQMKTRFLALTVIFATFVLCAGDVLAARKITTVQGILGESADGKRLLKTGGDSGYYFDPASEAGKKILSICQAGKTCVVRGVINRNNILTAYFVKMQE